MNDWCFDPCDRYALLYCDSNSNSIWNWSLNSCSDLNLSKSIWRQSYNCQRNRTSTHRIYDKPTMYLYNHLFRYYYSKYSDHFDDDAIDYSMLHLHYGCCHCDYCSNKIAKNRIWRTVVGYLVCYDYNAHLIGYLAASLLMQTDDVLVHLYRILCHVIFFDHHHHHKAKRMTVDQSIPNSHCHRTDLG